MVQDIKSFLDSLLWAFENRVHEISSKRDTNYKRGNRSAKELEDFVKVLREFKDSVSSDSPPYGRDFSEGEFEKNPLPFTKILFDGKVMNAEKMTKAEATVFMKKGKLE